MSFIQSGKDKLACECGNDVFITFGDKTGITTVECIACQKWIDILQPIGKIEKLLSEFGEDFCRVYGEITNNKAIVKYLQFTEFNTRLELK